MQDTKETKSSILFHRIIRVAFGTLFTSIGVLFYNEGAWPAILFGALFLITAFLRPKRCIADHCDINTNVPKNG